MADITMCTNSNCPKAKECYRKTAEYNIHRQSVAMFDYLLTEEGVLCDNYYPNDFQHKPK